MMLIFLANSIDWPPLELKVDHFTSGRLYDQYPSVVYVGDPDPKIIQLPLESNSL